MGIDLRLSSNISFHGKLFLSGGISNSPEVKFKWPMPGEKETFDYNNLDIEQDKKIAYLTDLFGREVDFKYNTPILIYYSDGTVSKRIIVK